MNKTLTATLIAVLSASTAPAPAASLTRLAEDLRRIAAPDARSAVVSLLRDEAAPTDCFSPVLLEALVGAEESAPLSRPLLVDGKSWDSPAGFRYHYTTRSGSPDAVQVLADDRTGATPRYLERLDEALIAAGDLLSSVGLRPPEGAPWIDVYVIRPGPGLSGYTVPGGPLPATFEEDRGGFLVLSPDLDDPFPAAAHQLTHLALLRYSFREPAWWHEATAAWVGVLAAGGAAHESATIGAHLSRPEIGLAADDLTTMRGSLLLPAYLGLGESPPRSVAAIWEECAALGGDNLLPALETVARGSGRGGLRDLLRAYYASWVMDAAGRSRLMAALGTRLPDPATAEEVSTYPAGGEPVGGPVHPLGAAFLHFVSDRQPGGVSLTFAGEPNGTWDTLLLVRRSPRHPFLAVPMQVDSDGRSRIRFPWAEVTDSLLIAVNLAESTEPARHVYQARHSAVIPFDMIELAANFSQGEVLLRWATDSEADVLGWNVYRSSRPGGPYEKLNRVLVPAAGSDRDPAGYRFLDHSARGRKVYYAVEAVTEDGFRQRTHPIGAYLPSRP